MSSGKLGQKDSAGAHGSASPSDSEGSSIPNVEIYDMDSFSSIGTSMFSQPASEDTRESSYEQAMNVQKRDKRDNGDNFAKQQPPKNKTAAESLARMEVKPQGQMRSHPRSPDWDTSSHYYTPQGKLVSQQAMHRRWYCVGGVLFSIAMVVLMVTVRIMYPRVPLVSLHSAKGGVIRLDLSTKPSTFIVELSSLFSIDNRQWFLPIILTNMEFSATNLDYSNDPILILNDPTDVVVPSRSRKAFLSQARISTRDLATMKNLPAALDCAEKYLESMDVSPGNKIKACTLHIRTKFESHYLGFKLSNHELNYDIVL